jgi:hypothetical protein
MTSPLVCTLLSFQVRELTNGQLEGLTVLSCTELHCRKHNTAEADVLYLTPLSYTAL